MAPIPTAVIATGRYNPTEWPPFKLCRTRYVVVKHIRIVMSNRIQFWHCRELSKQDTESSYIRILTHNTKGVAQHQAEYANKGNKAK